jgi:hypothetical protein
VNRVPAKSSPLSFRSEAEKSLSSLNNPGGDGHKAPLCLDASRLVAQGMCIDRRHRDPQEIEEIEARTPVLVKPNRKERDFKVKIPYLKEK